jgi:hypothetical protein
MCAFCHLLWDYLEPEFQAALQVAERYADSLATQRELKRMANVVFQRICQPATMPVPDFAARQKEKALAMLSRAVQSPAWCHSEATTPEEEWTHCERIRDVFGNPFRPVLIARSWLVCNASAVLGIARHIYEEKCFADMPILADALEDAGCSNTDILDHCRSEKEHVRGCWLLDLLLAKS